MTDLAAAPTEVPVALPARSPRVRAALGGVVVLALLGVGAAVVTTVATPGGQVVAVPDGDPGAGSAGDGGRVGSANPVDPTDPFGAPEVVVLHVLGAVVDPGIVELPLGSRVVDAIAAAGGPTDAADLAAVNLARVVADGEQLRLPAVGEAPPPGAAGAGGAGGAGSGVSADGHINLNTADAAGLEQLPGIGPAIAARIIAWREQNGPFRSVDELTAVSGIGQKTLDGLRDRATV